MKKEKVRQIKLGTCLTIDQVVDLKIKFDKEFKNGNLLELNSNEIQTIDLTGIQFLQHYISRAQQNNKQLCFNMMISSDQRIMLEKTGFSNLLETVFT